MRRLWLIVMVLCFAANAGAQTTASRQGELPALRVDLHAHLSMKPALGWLFRGSFDAPLVADSWDDQLSSKANSKSLQEAGVGVMVVALYAHPVFAGDMRQAVRNQIAEVEAFVRRRPKWAIARQASVADTLLRQGKRVIVLSLEGAAGVLESEADLREFIDERGIAIVTPLHLVDDRFGGAALLDGAQRVANPIALVDGRQRRLVDRGFEDGIVRNQRGLTLMGKRLLIELARRGVWIDLTHASDGAVKQMVPIIEAAGQPLLFTHTSPRHFRKAERALSDHMLEAVGRSGGMVGLLPSEDAMPNIPPASGYCRAGCEPDTCRGSVAGLAEVYSYLARFVSPSAIALGSDFNGGMRHLRPSCQTGTSIDHEAGFYQLGQTPALWRALRKAGAPVPEARETLRRFVEAWSRVIPAKLAGLDAMLPLLPSKGRAAGPGLDGRLRLGISSFEAGNRPGLLLGIEARVLKDSATVLDTEPLVYLADTKINWLTVPHGDVAPWLSASFAPVGILADDRSVRLEGQLGAARLVRDRALLRAWDLQVLALRARARAVPGLFYRPYRHHLFFDIGLGALGYRALWASPGAAAVHGFALGDLELRGGVTLSPRHAHVVKLYGSASAELALFGDGAEVRYASERALGMGVGVGLGTAGAELRLDARWIGWTDPASTRERVRDEVRATVVIPVGGQPR